MQAFVVGGLDLFEQLALAQEDAIRTGALDFFQAQSASGIGLRIQVK